MKTARPILFPLLALLITAVSSFSLGWMASNLYTNPKYISLEVSKLKGDELKIEKCWAESRLQTVDQELEDSHPVFGDMSKEEVLLDALKKGLNESQRAEVGRLYDDFSSMGDAVKESNEYAFYIDCLNSL